MNAISKIEKFIFEAPAWKLILAIAALTLFKTGIWSIPNLGESQAIADNPFTNPLPNPDAHYLLWSWLEPFLAWGIGIKSQWQFFVFRLLASIAFTLLFVRIAFVYLSNKLARSSIVLFSILPVSATAYFWVSGDALTLLLMLVALAFPVSLIFTCAVGVLLGMQHFEQGFFAAAGLLFAVAISHKQNYALKHSWKFCLCLLLGVIAGKLVLVGIFKHYDVQVNSGRAHWLQAHIGALLNQFFYHFHSIVWSVLGLGWLAALRFSDWSKKSVPFFLSLAGLCLLLPVSGDQTRVLAIVTFPLIFTYWLLNVDFLEKISKREVSVLFTLWALMPWAWVWEGTPRWSALPYDIAYLLHHAFGWFNVPADATVWPF
jgi:hypothetical protein